MNNRRPFISRKPARPSSGKRDQPEARLQKLVNRSLQSQFKGRCHVRDTNPEMVRVGQQAMRGATNKGRPDIVGHIYGLHIEIELKVSNNYPTSEQKLEIRRVNRTGAIAVVIVHVRSKDKYYLVLGPSVERFSYKSRDGWVLLPKFTDHKDTEFLLLEPLNYLLITKAAALVDLMTPTQTQQGD
jgi:hypothetical protein